MRRVWSVGTALFLAWGCGGKTSLEPGGGVQSPDAACTSNADCIVVPVSCCGSCGRATRGDVKAVNRGKYEPSAGNCVCPDCYNEPDPTLFATCDAGYCRVVDLSEDPSAQCTSDGDCHLRMQACCECGSSTDLSQVVAISDESKYADLVCDVGQACPACAPVYPSWLSAACSAGHCVTVTSGPSVGGAQTF
jgi:hypothetical protein